MRGMLCCLGAAAALAACGAVPRPAPAPAATTIGGPAAAPVVLHQQDAGHTVTVASGAVVEIQLPERHAIPGTSLTWAASSSAPGIVAMTGDRRDPAVTPVPEGPPVTYIADFVARAAGTAQLVAQGTQRCEAMEPTVCPQPSLTFTVVVR